MDVQLRDFVPFPAAGIGYIHGDRSRATCANHGGIHAQVVEVKRRVTQSPAERKQRLPAGEQVVAVHGRFVVVVSRKLAHRARKGDGKFPARIHVPEKHAGRCRAAFLAQIPAFHDRRRMFHRVVDRERPPINQEHDGRFAGLDHRLD